MKPINFKGANVLFAKDQKEYKPLPGFLNSLSPQGEFICCYKLTVWERIKIVFTGKIWLCLLTFNKPLTPSFMTTDKKDVFTKLPDSPQSHVDACRTLKL